jgi:hypothetical protein
MTATIADPGLRRKAYDGMRHFVGFASNYQHNNRRCSTFCALAGLAVVQAGRLARR